MASVVTPGLDHRLDEVEQARGEAARPPAWRRSRRGREGRGRSGGGDEPWSLPRQRGFYHEVRGARSRPPRPLSSTARVQQARRPGDPMADRQARTRPPPDVRPVLDRIRRDGFLGDGIVVDDVQPATEARYADLPGGVGSPARPGPRLARDHAALHPPARGLRPRPGRPRHRRGHADGQREDALLQPARSSTRSSRSPAPARSTSSPRRPSSRDQAAELLELMQAAEPDLATAVYDGDTPPAERRVIRDRAHVAHVQPGHAAHGRAPPPRPLDATLREPEVRRHRRAPHLPRASSAATWPTSSGACAASAASTAPTPSSWPPAPRSATPRPSPSACWSTPWRSWRRTGPRSASVTSWS